MNSATSYLKYLLLIIFLFMVTLANASTMTQELDGIQFSVTNIEFGEKINKRYHMQSDIVQQKTNTTGNDINYIAITYTVLNNNPNKKINLDTVFQFHLLDEFENQYRKLPRPQEYEKPILITDKHYPSIYPNESFTETVFFEAPIATATQLSFLIKASPLGEGKVVKLTLPIEPPTNTSSSTITTIPNNNDQIIDTKTPPVAPAPTTQRWVKIIYPRNAQTINRGEATQVHVETSGNPTSLILAALGTSYYDEHPERQNVYDLRIPYGYFTGALSINIIAQWDNGIDEPDIMSDTIFLDVKSPYRFLKGDNQPILEYFR